MKPIVPILLAAATALSGFCHPTPAFAAQPASGAAAPALRLVVIVIRHGVRSPTDPAELAPYAAHAWPIWKTPPGYLTAHGTALIKIEGESYRQHYAQAGITPAGGCPSRGALYVWADVDERTQATADALISGIAPGCGITKSVADTKVDPLFHALPALGKADTAASHASVAGAIGGDPAALVTANGAAFAALEGILGCASGPCAALTSVASDLVTSSKTGLTAVTGPIDLASTAVEDFILEYAEGMPAADVGWGRVDRPTLLWLAQLHMLKYAVDTQTQYAARSQGSNLLATIAATIDQGADGKQRPHTPVPPTAKFAAFVGHDTNLEELAGLLHLMWLIPGYQIDDTPPGGALVFEVYASSAAPQGAFVRTFYSAQTLDQMRTGTSVADAAPLRAAVFVPGCPDLDCPLATFDSVVSRAIDPQFVAQH